MKTALVSVVTAGTETIEECPDCGSDRMWCDLVALTDQGPVTIGRLVDCMGACGEYFACAYCPKAVEFDGSLIFRHILRLHGTRHG